MRIRSDAARKGEERLTTFILSGVKPAGPALTKMDRTEGNTKLEILW